MTQILLIAIIAEVILLLLLGILKKLTKQIFIGIALITAIVAGIFFVRMRSVEKAQKSFDEKEYLYMAAKLLEQSQPKESLEALTMVEDETTAEYGVRAVRGLAYNMNDAFKLCLEYLEDPADENETAVYDASVGETAVEDAVRDQITGNTIRLLALDEDRTSVLDEELKIRFISDQEESQDEITTDDYIYAARAAMVSGNYTQAYELVKAEADAGNTDADVILSQMYSSGFDNGTLSAEDPEYDQLLKELTTNEVAMQRYQLQKGETETAEVPAALGPNGQVEIDQDDQLERSILLGRYNLSKTAIDMERTRRAINYLEFNKTDDSETNIAYNLQLAHLYYGVNEYDKAAEHLDKIFGKKEMDLEQVLGMEAYLLREAYVVGQGEEGRMSFNSSYEQLMSSLYMNIIPDYVDGGFQSYLEEYFHDLLGGIQISNLDYSNFPAIQAKVHTISDDFELSDAAEIFIDSGDEVKDLKIEKEELGKISICYVLDVSGSMSGDRIENAKKAIYQSILNTDEDTEVSLVSFESNAAIQCGLTTSKTRVIGALNGLRAEGGTSIASGLSLAADVLQGATGTKIVILLSDGQDGNPEMLPAALQKVQSVEAMVQTIGLSGSDENYLTGISESTAGSYVAVENSYDLVKTYDEIQKYMKSSYTVTYTVNDEKDQMRYLDIRSSGNAPTHERKWYSTAEEVTDLVDYSKIVQSADFFKQTGGTK